MNRGFGGTIRINQIFLQSLHAVAALNIVLAECDVPNDLHVTGIVVFVTRVNLQLHILIILGFCERFLLTVIVIVETVPDAVRDTAGITNASEITSQIQTERAFFIANAATQDTAAFQDTFLIFPFSNRH